MEARHFGVVINRKSGEVVRVFNPDFERELDGHHVGQDEFMLRVPKEQFGVGLEPNAMRPEHVHKIIGVFGPWPKYS